MKKYIYYTIIPAFLIFAPGLFLQTTFAQDDTDKNPVVEALEKSAWEKFEEGKLDAAIEDYTKIISIEPENADALARRGDAFLQKGEYDKAIADYDKTLEIKPDDFFTFYNRGRAYYKKGDYEKAIEDHTSELELQSRRDLGRLSRGSAYMKLEQYDEAIDDFNRAIAQSLTPAAYLGRGRAFEKKGDTAGTIGDLRYYLEEFPDAAAVRASLIKLGVKETELPAPLLTNAQKIPTAAREKFDAAMQKFEDAEYDEVRYELGEAIKIYPQFAVAYFYRGLAYEIPGSLIRYREVQANYNKAIELDPKFSEAYARRAYNQFYNNPQWKTIKPDLTRAVTLDPKSAHAVFYRGMFTWATDAKKLLDINLALKLHPFYAAAILERADLFKEQKKYDKAFADYAAVLKINPNDYRVYESRAGIYCEQGKKDLAKAEEGKAEELGLEINFPCS
jgi:tetratricopeptide (TPR) repeat protein